MESTGLKPDTRPGVGSSRQCCGSAMPLDLQALSKVLVSHPYQALTHCPLMCCLTIPNGSSTPPASKPEITSAYISLVRTMSHDDFSFKRG